MKILIVEDEKNIALGIENILKKLCPISCSVQYASNGLEAWEHYQDSPLDLIITDIRMQNMDGLDMMERFHKKNTALKFIVISGYDNFSYAQRAIRCNVVDYLLKPVNTDLLLDAVMRAYQALPENYKKRMEHSLPDLPYFQFDLHREGYPTSIKNLISYLEKNYIKDVSLQSFSDEYLMNPNYISSLIKKHTGHSFSFLIDYIRISKAAELLLYEPDLSISEISYLVGYNNERRLYQAFQKRLECTPGNFRKDYGNRNLPI